MTTTYTLSIPPKFWNDHADRCAERDISTVKKGKRVLVELTGDEVADLYSDAIHYSDASDFDWEDARAMSISARATVKAIATQIENIDELTAAWRANERAAREAWEASAEYAARQAAIEAEREARHLAEYMNPAVRNISRGRRVRHDHIDNEWHEVESTAFKSGTHHIRTTGGTIMVRGNWDATVSDLGIEIEA